MKLCLTICLIIILISIFADFAQKKLRYLILFLIFFNISEINEGKMTVGKIYVGLLIAENWKAYKASQSSSFGLKIVSNKGQWLYLKRGLSRLVLFLSHV